MSYYGGTITVQGRNLITSLIAGETIEFTRITVGSGAMPDGVEPIDMTGLVEPVAEAVSTVPIIENNVLSMVVEYRNDLNGGLKKGFWLREFGIFARTGNTEEVLLYYATLGDSPQPVNALKDNRIDIRRYPITIALELDADVQISYNPGAFITSGEAKELISSLVDGKMSGFRDAVDEAVESIKKIPAASVTQIDITIPATGWVEDTDTGGAYALHTDVAVAYATEDLIPVLTLPPESQQAARACGMCTTVRTMDGILRVYAAKIPTADIPASLVLLGSGGAGGGVSGTGYTLPVATATRLGGVQVRKGSGLCVDDDGNLSLDTATAADVEAVFDKE